MADMDMTGRKALVIGADGGLGRTAALALAGMGMKLALAGAEAADLMRTAALTGRPLDMLVLPADLEKKRDADNIMRILEGHYKGLDALVNASEEPAALALCKRALPLLRTCERPVILCRASDAESLAGAAGDIRVEALDQAGADIPRLVQGK